MNIIVGDEKYRIENDMDCTFFKSLLETKDSEVELSLFQDVFKDIYHNTLQYDKYEYNYLKQALAYFGHDKHLDIFLKKERLLNFISKYPDRFFWGELSKNSNIPIWFFEKHLNRVDWFWLCLNKNIPVKFYEKHLDKVHWSALSQNESIPLEFFEKHINNFDNYGYELSKNIIDRINKL